MNAIHSTVLKLESTAHNLFRRCHHCCYCCCHCCCWLLLLLVVAIIWHVCLLIRLIDTCLTFSRVIAVKLLYHIIHTWHNLVLIIAGKGERKYPDGNIISIVASFGDFHMHTTGIGGTSIVLFSKPQCQLAYRCENGRDVKKGQICFSCV